VQLFSQLKQFLVTVLHLLARMLGTVKELGIDLQQKYFDSV